MNIALNLAFSYCLATPRVGSRIYCYQLEGAAIVVGNGLSAIVTTEQLS